MEEGKGHFVQLWELPGIGSSRRPNPDRGRRVAQPRDQSRIPMSAAAPPGNVRSHGVVVKRSVRWWCPKHPLAGAAPQRTKGCWKGPTAPRGAETPLVPVGSLQEEGTFGGTPTPQAWLATPGLTSAWVLEPLCWSQWGMNPQAGGRN